MNIDSIDLHDAVIKNVAMDFSRREIVIGIDYYQAPDASVRRPGYIVFLGVNAVSQNIDFLRLSSQEWAGNITYWVPSVGRGVTYIYLSDGFVSVDAEVVDIASTSEAVILASGFE